MRKLMLGKKAQQRKYERKEGISVRQRWKSDERRIT